MYDFSVVIPAYNAERYIAETVDSVLNQTFSNFECIVIDDGSTDNTVNILDSYDDPRLKVISIENSGGPSRPRNQGIKKAKGHFIFMNDADDVMLPNKMSEYHEILMKNPQVEFIFSDFSFINSNSEIVKKSFLKDYTEFRKILTPVNEHFFELNRDKTLKELIKANFIGISSVCFKKRLSDNNNIFDESVHASEDILAWSYLSQKTQFFLFNKVMHKYRIHSESVSNHNVEKFLKYKMLVLEKINNIIQTSDEKYELIKKMDEYKFSLGYHYFKVGMHSKARDAYSQISDSRINYNVWLSIAKTYIAQALRL